MPFLRSTNFNVLGYSTISKCSVLGYSKLDLQRLNTQSGYQKMSNNEQQLITAQLFPTAFSDFKTMIFDYVAIPLLRNEDDFLSENLYMITIIRNRLDALTTSFPKEDFTFYKHIVDLISMAFEKTELLDKYEIDDNIKIGINIRGREWINPEGQTKYFNSIQGWRIEKIEIPDIENKPESFIINNESPPQDVNEEEDDLPF